MNRRIRLFADLVVVLAILLSSCVKDSQPGKDDNAGDNTEVGPGGDDNGDDNDGGDNGDGDNTGGDNGDGDNTGGDNGDGGNTGGDNPVESTCIHPWFELPAVDYVKSGNYLVSQSDETLYFAHHYCAGGEKGPDGKVARNFSVCYSSKYHCPVWVAAPLHQMYKAKGRHDNYKNDPDIPGGIQRGKWDGYTKGHMLGSSDRNKTVATNHQVFYYSNIAPQVGGTFNTGGGAWNNLEAKVDGWMCSDTLYAVIGCYFDKFTDKYGSTVNPKILDNGTHYPTAFYYALVRTKSGSSKKSLKNCKASEIQSAAFILRHTMEKGHKPQSKDMMSISELEELTGFTYFTNVPQLDKTQCKPSDWGL